MIGFYTKFTTTEQNRDALVDILKRAAYSMNEIEDCKLYIVNTNQNDGTIIWVTEMWTTKESHMASLLLESSKALIQKAMPLMAVKPEQIKLDVVSGKGMS